ncbi:MAG: hypothetical protein E6G39_09945 [Actinobacteria bacterium]|nr:MAG: hypothetical protein E6G39_09945 [Actinomycetota bacterium]
MSIHCRSASNPWCRRQRRAATDRASAGRSRAAPATRSVRRVTERCVVRRFSRHHAILVTRREPDSRRGTIMKLRTRVAVILAAIGLIAAACGDNKSGGTSAATTGGTATAATSPPTTKTPVTGGTLTFGSYSKISGLDPIVGLGQGTSGGIPMAALYDSLVRYNQDTKKYEMRTAESVTPSADSLEWTVKIKPGIKFTDGTDYDAEAVRFGMNRHRVGNGIPATDCALWWACPRIAREGHHRRRQVDVEVHVERALHRVLLQPVGRSSHDPVAHRDEEGVPRPDEEPKHVSVQSRAGRRGAVHGRVVQARRFHQHGAQSDLLRRPDVSRQRQLPRQW